MRQLAQALNARVRQHPVIPKAFTILECPKNLGAGHEIQDNNAGFGTLQRNRHHPPELGPMTPHQPSFAAFGRGDSLEMRRAGVSGWMQALIKTGFCGARSSKPTAAHRAPEGKHACPTRHPPARHESR